MEESCYYEYEITRILELIPLFLDKAYDEDLTELIGGDHYPHNVYRDLSPDVLMS